MKLGKNINSKLNYFDSGCHVCLIDRKLIIKKTGDALEIKKLIIKIYIKGVTGHTHKINKYIIKLL